jgi:monoamine oxidase
MDENQINPPELLQIARSGLPRKTDRPAKIAVLGAGIAGLVAAVELRRAGHEVTVLEAQSRVGGRILTLREGFSDGVYAEAGAMRIPGRHQLVMAYVKRLGLDLRPFNSHNDRAWAFFHRHRLRLGEALDENVGYGFKLSAEEQRVPFQEMWDRTLEPIQDAMREESTVAWEVIQQRLQRVSLREFLRDLGWSEGAIEKYGLFAGFETLLHASACEFIREFVADLRSATYAIRGGMDLLPRGLADELGNDIRYGQMITALDQTDDQVIIHTRGLGGQKIVKADYAVCTLPLSVLRHIEVLKPFSYGKQQAIRNIHYEAATKIFFECSRRFWETDDNIFGGSSVTDLAIRNVYYPEHNRRTGRGVLLASYSHGQDAHRWGALSEHERLVQALENVAEIHPQVTQYVESGRSVVWNQDEFAGGAYAFFQPNQERELHAHILAAEGRYHFAGEHASLQHRWIQGSVESALRASVAIHELTLATPAVTASAPAQNGNTMGAAMITDDQALAHYATDYGDVTQCELRGAVRPTSTRELTQAVQYAHNQSLTVLAPGTGRITGDGSQVSEGLVIDMTALNCIHRIDLDNHCFEADAGVTWRELLDALLPLGVTHANVSDKLDLTLVDTVSAGGVGVRCVDHGLLADLVEALEVVTVSGDVLWCSPDRNTDLFNGVRDGLEHFGIISRIKMRLNAAPCE